MDSSIEIQWKLLEGFIGRFPDFSFFNQHTVERDKQGNYYPHLMPTFDFIVIASNHFIKEPLATFKYVIDIGCIIRSKGHEIDHNYVEGFMRKAGYLKMYINGMAVVEELTGLTLNNRSYLSSAEYTKLLISNLMNNKKINRSTLFNFTNYKLLFILQDSTINRIKLTLRILLYWILPSSGDVNFFKLPPYLFPLLIILRPFRLFFKFVLKKDIQ